VAFISELRVIVRNVEELIIARGVLTDNSLEEESGITLTTGVFVFTNSTIRSTFGTCWTNISANGWNFEPFYWAIKETAVHMKDISSRAS
jgi:hypothetical protein